MLNICFRKNKVCLFQGLLLSSEKKNSLKRLVLYEKSHDFNCFSEKKKQLYKTGLNLIKPTTRVVNF